MEDPGSGQTPESGKRKAAATASLNISKNSGTRLKIVSSILRKKCESLSVEDKRILEENAELVKEYYKRKEKRKVWKSRQFEQEDSQEDLEKKCLQMAQAIHDAEFLVVYTGAGISTAASIPDYRGPNGIWTLLQKGQDIGHHDLSAAEPTLTHMALSSLYHQGTVKHVVSQNCDGLHLRSGLPKSAMSELHGNMYIEVCKHCVPAREYVRTFDVTERTSTFKHTTGRRCYRCGEPLIDTIVHFGERGKLRWPLNWQGACQAANSCDTILCLGSSLKVLKKYPWLWQMDRPPKKRPSLYIVNLQWTPKDKDATLKINGRCDVVMALVMKALGYELPYYLRSCDPIFHIATRLHEAETSISTRPQLIPPVEEDVEPDVENLTDDNDTKDFTKSASEGDVRWQSCDGDLTEENKREKVVEQTDEKPQVKSELDNCDVKTEVKCEIKTELESVKDESKDHLKTHLNGMCSGALDLTQYKFCKSEDEDENSENLCKGNDDIINAEQQMDDVKQEELCNNDDTWSSGLGQLYKALTGKNIDLNEPYSNDFNECMQAEDISSEVSQNESNVMSLEESLGEGDNQSDVSEHAAINESFEEPIEDDESRGQSAEEITTECHTEPAAFPNSMEEEEDDEARNEPAEEITTECPPTEPAAYPNSMGEEDDVKSDLSESDEDVHSSEGEDTWLSDMSAENIESPRLDQVRSSDASSDSESSEKSYCDRGENVNLEESNDSSLMNYYKLALASSNLQMIEHSQSLLKQNQFYGTGLCIRSLGGTKDKVNQKCSRNPERDFDSLTSINQEPLDLSVNVMGKELVNNSENFRRLNSDDSCDIRGHVSENANILCGVELSSLPSCHKPLSDLLTIGETKSLQGNDECILLNASCDDTVGVHGLSRLPVNDGVPLISEEERCNDNQRVLEEQTQHIIDMKAVGINGYQELDNSLLVRTCIVDGVIQTACAENVEDGVAENLEDGDLDLQHNTSPNRNLILPSNCNIDVSTNSNLSFNKLKIPTPNSFLRKQLDEREELKSIWYKSFCNDSIKSPNSLNSELKVRNGKIVGRTERFDISAIKNDINATSEKSSAFILKDICDEAMNDRVARQKGSTKRKLKGCDNEDVKYIWFWGFNNSSESTHNISDKNNEPINLTENLPFDTSRESAKDAESSDGSDSPPAARITRSRTRASTDVKVTIEPDVFRCHCNGSNTELCEITRQSQPKEKCDEDVQKARDIFMRRRTYNYRRYEPVFEKELESFTYERSRAKRKSKFELMQENEEDLEDDEDDLEAKEEEQKMSDVEESKEKDEKEEKKFAPGWYGKGLRKGMKKKTRV